MRIRAKSLVTFHASSALYTAAYQALLSLVREGCHDLLQRDLSTRVGPMSLAASSALAGLLVGLEVLPTPVMPLHGKRDVAVVPDSEMGDDGLLSGRPTS